MKVEPVDTIIMFSCLACADAYLTPHIKRYVQGFSNGFQKQLEVSNLENICSKSTIEAEKSVDNIQTWLRPWFNVNNKGTRTT